MRKSRKQMIQQGLSWKLKCVMGAQGTLYPRERCFSRSLDADLMWLYGYLKILEDKLRKELKDIT